MRVSPSPSISVIMPVYNTAEYLRDAIESILNQTFTDFEFIIIDDASTDGSKEIIKSYADDRIIIIENDINKGYVYGLNYAISISRGDFIARMDSDDISMSNRLQLQYSFMIKNEDVIVCGTNIKIIGTDTIIKYPEKNEEIKLGLLESNELAHPSVIIRKHCINNINNFNGPYNNSFVPSEDYELWTKLIFKGKFYNLQQELLNYRKHDKQISNLQARVQISKFMLIKRNYIIRFFSEKFISKQFQQTNKQFKVIENREYYILSKYKSHPELKNQTKQLEILQLELDTLKKNIFEKRHLNTIKGLFLILNENPKILIYGNKKTILAYLKRVLMFTFFPLLRDKSIYLN